jgi:hypothetical protein
MHMRTAAGSTFYFVVVLLGIRFLKSAGQSISSFWDLLRLKSRNALLISREFQAIFQKNWSDFVVYRYIPVMHGDLKVTFEALFSYSRAHT